MALTDAQDALRETRIGASEIGATIGLDPQRSPLDIWLRKRTPGRAPLAQPDKVESEQAMMGRLHEPMMARYYSERYGIDVRQFNGFSIVHSERDWQLASPDAAVGGDLADCPDDVASLERAERLLQFKAVGTHMRWAWDLSAEQDLLPDHVLCQVQQEMDVTGKRRNDVVALLGVTEAPRVYRISFDPDLAGALRENGERFVRDYILGDTPPPVGGKERLGDYLRKRFPHALDEDLLAIADNDEPTQALVTRYRKAKANLKQWGELKDEIAARLEELIGTHRGLAGVFGRVVWGERRGMVSWKDVAIATNGGVDFPEEKLAPFRGADFRRLDEYPPSKKGRK